MKKKNEFSRAAARGVAHSAPAHAETARDGETPRALMFLQNRPRTSPELQISTNTISPSLITSHLIPWPFPNSPVRTPGDSVHGGTERLRRPPRTYVGPPNGSITISDPSGYAKRRCRVTRLGKAAAARGHP